MEDCNGDVMLLTQLTQQTLCTSGGTRGGRAARREHGCCDLFGCPVAARWLAFAGRLPVRFEEQERQTWPGKRQRNRQETVQREFLQKTQSAPGACSLWKHWNHCTAYSHITNLFKNKLGNKQCECKCLLNKRAVKILLYDALMGNTN